MWQVWGRRNAYMGLIDKSERKKSLGRTRHRWLDNIKVGYEVGWEDVGVIWM